MDYNRWTIEDEKRLREIRPWMCPGHNWRNLDPLWAPEPLPSRIADRLVATLLADPAAWGRLLISCGLAARRESR